MNDSLQARAPLYVRVDGDGPALLLLHGFTGSADSWDEVCPAWTATHRVIRPDLIGHGRSPAPKELERYRMDAAVRELLELLDGLGVHRFRLLGYSMGGRLALHLALAAPGRVERLILESATYGIADPAQRAARRAEDNQLAAWIETHGVDAFARRWAAHPLFATQGALPPARRERQARERRMHSAVGLANSLRGMGTGAQASLRDRLGELKMPVLLIAGEYDEKFTALAREMAALIPRAQLAIVPGAGHNVHLEQPQAFAERVSAFLAQERKERSIV